MFKTDIEFKKGVLFVRIDGELNKTNSIDLRKSIIPLLLKYGFRYVVLNLDNVNYIDNYAMELFEEINDIVIKYNGKTTLIKNRKLDKLLKGSLIEKILYKVKNEKSALGVFEL